MCLLLDNNDVSYLIVSYIAHLGGQVQRCEPVLRLGVDEGLVLQQYVTHVLVTVLRGEVEGCLTVLGGGWREMDR